MAYKLLLNLGHAIKFGGGSSERHVIEIQKEYDIDVGHSPFRVTVYEVNEDVKFLH